MFVADGAGEARHQGVVIGHAQLLADLERLKSAGRTTNAELARLLGLPSSRIAEVFKGSRQVRVDEMKAIVEHFGLEDQRAVAPSAENLEPILDALLPLAPPGRLTDQSRRALAEALSYGLELLGSSIATPANEHALGVAARAAVARFRETATA